LKNSLIQIFNKYKEIDALFRIIKFHPNLTKFQITSQYKELLESEGITENNFKAIIDKLKLDNHVIESASYEYSINPLSKDFLGYYYKHIQENEKILIERKYRNVPIIISLIAVLVTLGIGILNYEMGIKNYNLNNSNKEKDSIINRLKKEVELKEVGKE